MRQRVFLLCKDIPHQPVTRVGMNHCYVTDKLTPHCTKGKQGSVFSVCRGEGGVVEDGIGSPDISHGAEVREGKAIQILSFIANGAQGKPPVSNAQTTAVPVVNRLYTRILECAVYKIVPSIGGQVES